MRKIVFIAFACLVVLFACNNEKTNSEEVSTDLINNPATASDMEPVNEENLPIFEFEESVQSFGEISQGEIVSKKYTFTNIGKSDLLIADAKGSCGCTVPNYPKKPIRPGEKGHVEVVFDSNNKQGKIHKTITLIANTIPNRKVLVIKGDVLVPTQKK